jgi:hypothetical protein
VLTEFGNANYFISLILPNFCRRNFKKIQTIKYLSRSFQFIVNRADPTTFLLTYYINNERYIQLCKLVEKEIIIEDSIKIDFYPNYFDDKHIYTLDSYKRDDKYKTYVSLFLYISS